MGAEGRLETLPQCVQGLEESAHCAPVLLALRELFSLHDPTLLGLEVAGLRQKFPDVRCGEKVQGRRKEPWRARAGLTTRSGIPAARTMSPPSWSCVGTCPESIARQHSALYRPAHRPHLPLAAVPSSASYRRLRPHCPPASPRVPAPDPSVCVIKPRPPRV